MAKYQRPVLLLNKVINPEVDIVDGLGTVLTKRSVISWEGSGRGYDKSKFDNLREFLKESGMALLSKMEIHGERALEESLLSRINTTHLHTIKTENDYGTNNE